MHGGSLLFITVRCPVTETSATLDSQGVVGKNTGSAIGLHSNSDLLAISKQRGMLILGQHETVAAETMEVHANRSSRHSDANVTMSRIWYSMKQIYNTRPGTSTHISHSYSRRKAEKSPATSRDCTALTLTHLSSYYSPPTFHFSTGTRIQVNLSTLLLHSVDMHNGIHGHMNILNLTPLQPTLSRLTRLCSGTSRSHAQSTVLGTAIRIS